MGNMAYLFVALFLVGVISVISYFVMRMIREKEYRTATRKKESTKNETIEDTPASDRIEENSVEKPEKTFFDDVKSTHHAQQAYDDTDEEKETAPLPMVYRDEIPETENIDTDCFAYFKGARVLLAEDNLINQKIVQKVLRHSGIALDIADNGKIAVEKLNENPDGYDLVLMDISMPVMDGFDATKRIRSDKRFDRLPIVTFTAFNLGPEIERMFSLGANAYLTKPLNIHKLYTVFSLYLGNVNRGLSMERMLEIQGLHVRKAIETLEGDEEAYRELLEQFVWKYAALPDLVPKWIEKGDFARLSLECKMLQEDLEAIGADDMAHYVHGIRKHFIYRTEGLLSKHRLLFRTRMQAILDTIQVYLKHLQKRVSGATEHSEEKSDD